MRQPIKNHTALKVWQSSRFLARAAHNIAALFPDPDKGTLADEIRRAAIAVSGNIAEGCGRGTTVELIRSLRIARGCVAQLHSHLTLAADLGYSKLSVDHPIFVEVAEVMRMIDAQLASLSRRSTRSPGGREGGR